MNDSVYRRIWMVVARSRSPVVYGFVLRMLSQNRSKSSMIYDSFADFSGVLHIATSFAQSCWNLSRMGENFSGCLGNCWFYRESAYPRLCVTKMDSLGRLFVTHKANTGVSWVHITTRNETSRNRPRPNKYRKRWIFSNSPYSLHYVTILQG